MLNVRSGVQTGLEGTSTATQSGAQRRAAAARADALKQAPWTAANTPTETVAKSRVRDILAGKSVVTTSVRTPAGGLRTDQEQLFGAFRALEGLRLLAERAQTDGVPESEMLALQTRFRASMAEVSKYLSSMELQRVIAPVGAKTEEIEGVYSLSRARTEYVTRAVHTGPATDAVKAWSGLAGFTITANPGEASQKTITIDLSELGATPRTLDTVIGFINSKLEINGLQARLSKVQLPAAAGAKPTDPPSFALRVKGVAAEELSFAPLSSARSVMALTASGAAQTRAGQLTKLDDVAGSTARFTEALNGDPLRFVGTAPTGLNVRASATAADGSVYVVGDTGTPIGAGMGLRGETDVVLAKYDSAGRRVWTRTLGATQAGQGFSVAVGADGTVAVAGAVRGFAADQTSKGGLDAIVATFDDAGNEEWVRQIGTTGTDEARAVAIAADGTVYVGGRTTGALSGASGGAGDGFVASFSATGQAGFVRQFADAGEGGVNALAVTANGLVVGGESAGKGVVRKLDTAGADVWNLETAALGSSGGVRALAVNGADIVVVGATTTDALGVGGTALTEGGGGGDAFAMKLTDGTAPTTVWTKTFGGARLDVANAVAIEGGDVYLASTQQRLKDDGRTVTTRAIVDKIALGDGSSVWSKTVGEEGAQAVGLTLDANGASDLDAFGLPNGPMLFEDGAPLVRRTALRVGDSFTLKINGGSSRKIAIEADDTLATLAKKINATLRTAGKAEVKSKNSADYLVISATEGSRIDLANGPEGRDVLEVLGLPAGEARMLRKERTAGTSSKTPQPPVMPLNFRDDLAFSDAASARKVRLDIERVQRSVRTAFEYIYNPPAPATKKPAVTGPAPAQMQAQLANYQAGLARLQSFTDSGSGTTDPTLALFGGGV